MVQQKEKSYLLLQMFFSHALGTQRSFVVVVTNTVIPTENNKQCKLSWIMTVQSVSFPQEKCSWDSMQDTIYNAIYMFHPKMELQGMSLTYIYGYSRRKQKNQHRARWSELIQWTIFLVIYIFSEGECGDFWSAKVRVEGWAPGNRDREKMPVDMDLTRNELLQFTSALKYSYQE